MTPRELYDERARMRNAHAERLRTRERQLSIARLAVFALLVLLAFLAPWFSLAALAAFVVLLVLHDRVITARRRAERAAAFYRRGLARLDDAWRGNGDPGTDFADDHHPYAGDFDLFGRGSLFEMLSLCATRAGRARLAEWLKAPSLEPSEIASRQEAVRELRDNVDLREDLAIVAGEVAPEIEAAKLETWGAMAEVRFASWERVLLPLLAAAATILALLAIPELIFRIINSTHGAGLHAPVSVPGWPLILVILLEIGVYRVVAARTASIVDAVERAEPALALLAQMLARIDRERFTSARLSAMHGRLPGAEAEVARLRKLVALLDARRNQFFAPIAGLLMWTPLLALRIEQWRRRSGRNVSRWIGDVGELEALISFASFAFEHPAFTIPEVVAEGPLFDARDLGHPLIPDARRIVNDLRLGRDLQLLVVSGSNMSGKSTMLRSTGIAAVLALAGAPVCASSLRIAPMAIGASIRINDSLQEGASRFYAEILRIRQILDLSRGPAPLLFLLDEVLAGTNSHDRRIGAEAIVRTVVERGGIGLVSTHDLALASIADALAPRAANVHFEDHLEADKVVFDYRMREGVVTRSNALALMRSVGIDV